MYYSSYSRGASDGLITLYVLIGIAAFIIGIALAVKFGDIAERKGYSKTAYGWGVFLLGIPMMIMVAALPDLVVRNWLAKLNGTAPNSGSDTATDASSNTAESAPTAPADEETSSFKKWLIG